VTGLICLAVSALVKFVVSEALSTPSNVRRAICAGTRMVAWPHTPSVVAPCVARNAQRAILQVLALGLVAVVKKVAVVEKA